ncbi:hypothetical protein PUNSTDRAFT_134459 [Punctularia strigosozonata HHB-11173 SS5]|uniref:uncharacterized protein n=1 Tax=Punctularia strigosozonata (strain HHB-11173) TaxID=741275 RepID=UPI0004417A29|nr:uncharacterized protein PUNSTDRAFT_134459 [Punctularia strigosozonata HHB-11173 SS5]EIN09303.1 hypothetical protein PUNSTDRAFT_134459 [Punctularia strigosozonata HHB-11173 SS5]
MADATSEDKAPRYWVSPGGAVALVSPEGPIDFERITPSVLEEIRDYDWLRGGHHEGRGPRPPDSEAAETSMEEWSTKAWWFSGPEPWIAFVPALTGLWRMQWNVSWIYEGPKASLAHLEEVETADGGKYWTLARDLEKDLREDYEGLQDAILLFVDRYAREKLGDRVPRRSYEAIRGSDINEACWKWAKACTEILTSLGFLRMALLTFGPDKFEDFFAEGLAVRLRRLRVDDFGGPVKGAVFDLHSARNAVKYSDTPTFSSYAFEKLRELGSTSVYLYPLEAEADPRDLHLDPRRLGAKRQVQGVPEAVAQAQRARVGVQGRLTLHLKKPKFI